MCKIGVVDHEYIRQTCDMRIVNEKYLNVETERYTQRYASQKMTDTSIISSLDWKYGFSIGRSVTQQLEKTFKKRDRKSVV